ncbi:MAG: tetratricopeptide repeat protein [Calothrix sp. SM1_5_4]|nr:tetratricopeptide repeat protein [Calothrix sp. SM1_5_4]
MAIVLTLFLVPRMAPIWSAIFLTATLLFSACASRDKVGAEASAPDQAAPPELGQGLRALEHEDYRSAAEIFDRLLVAKPATEMDLVILFNSAAAHEGLGRCSKAAERYREVVRSSAGRFESAEAQALFRLSLMYECLGDDTKAVAALLDARKRGGRILPGETLKAEIPARLAVAYSRLGNRAKALEYFSQASEGLKSVVATSARNTRKETLSKTLYFMGKLNPAQRSGEGEPEAYLYAISMQQPYLLQAIETGHRLWASKASDDLRTAYDNIGISRSRTWIAGVSSTLAPCRRRRNSSASGFPARGGLRAACSLTSRRLSVACVVSWPRWRRAPS